MLPKIQHLLKASPAVTALIGAGTDPIADPVRVYRHGDAPQGVTAPYVTWSAPAGAPENTFDGPDADFWRVHVDCWSDGDLQVEQLAEAVRNALEVAAHCVAYTANERNPETKRYRIGFAFDFILSRN
jgi:hypothetical protein